jgi:hypothetical protein
MRRRLLRVRYDDRSKRGMPRAGWTLARRPVLLLSRHQPDPARGDCDHVTVLK